MPSPIARLIDFGQSPWYDNLTRTLLRDGGLARLFEEDGVRGVTSNPTIFEKAMGSGDVYDDGLRACEAAGQSIEESYWSLVTEDIAEAADMLRPVYDQTDGADGFVSLEVSPDIAHDTEATCKQARELFERVGRPNLMIKIPAALAGLPAITRTIAAGINVNITLIFAIERHDQVINAYLDGLEELDASGGDLSKIASVASFFVSRVDTETDRRLPEDHLLRGRAAVANAKLAYALFKERFSGERWDALAAKGARVQRPLWASTSTKNPDYSSTLYVDELIGRDTVNTLAQPSIDALHSGEGTQQADTVEEDLDGARKVIEDLADEGVDFDDVTATLESEGIDSFSTSFHDALSTLEKKRAEVS
jgi:transaldolase